MVCLDTFSALFMTIYAPCRELKEAKNRCCIYNGYMQTAL
jgi:hypothetical protein